MIDITLLGTSALLPLPDRALTALHLRCAGHGILFDCGEGTQTALRKYGISPVKIDIIALTHYHGDHIFGLPGLLQTMGMLGRTQPLYLLGPGDMERELMPILVLAGGLPYELRLITPPAEGLHPADLAPGWPEGAVLTPIPTKHRVISQGYRFTLLRPGKFQPEAAAQLGVPQKDWGLLQKGQSVRAGLREIRPDMVLGPERKGLSVVFSGDTAFCRSLIQGAKDADVLVCEATYGEAAQAELAADHGHMTFSQAAATAAEAGVKELWLTHYSQMVKEPEEYLPLARAIFPNTVCGRDGMQTKLQFEG